MCIRDRGNPVPEYTYSSASTKLLILFDSCQNTPKFTDLNVIFGNFSEGKTIRPHTGRRLGAPISHPDKTIKYKTPDLASRLTEGYSLV